MKSTIQNIQNKELVFSQLAYSDHADLLEYLLHFDSTTQQNFGPHSYTADGIKHVLKSAFACIARQKNEKEILAYFLIQPGILNHDKPRLESYHLDLNNETFCTFAPSVSQNWQNIGLGSAMLIWLKNELLKIGFRHVILWGGVKKENKQAVNFYRKAGFQVLGTFEYYGQNYDMVLDLEK